MYEVKLRIGLHSWTKKTTIGLMSAVVYQSLNYTLAAMTLKEHKRTNIVGLYIHTDTHNEIHS